MLLLLLLLLVGPAVELEEEYEEGDHVGGADDALDDGEAAVVVVGQQQAVEQHSAELEHLQRKRRKKTRKSKSVSTYCTKRNQTQEMKRSPYLQLGEVPLPPEVLLEAGSEGRQEVVGVHDDVDEGVEQGAERLVATRHEPVCK